MLPQGNESSDYNITIKVEIMNQEGSRHEEIIFAKVRAVERPNSVLALPLGPCCNTQSSAEDMERIMLLLSSNDVLS